jgi:transposase
MAPEEGAIHLIMLNAVEPLGYLADVLTMIAKGHPNSRLDELLPWAYIHRPKLGTPLLTFNG